MHWIITFLILFICLPIAIAGVSMAPWVPTFKKDILRLLDILELKQGETFLEIGCGDGRVSRAVALRFPGSEVIGIELAFPMYIIAKIRNISGPKNLKIQFANAFKQDLGNYDAIYVYGMPDKMSERIIPQFLSQAKPGVKLYSYIFSIPKKYNTGVVSYGVEGEAKIHVLEKK